MQSNIFKPLPFLPSRHHLNRWAFGYYLVKKGFSTCIVMEETSFTYKQIRKIREDLAIKEHRRASYGQDILSKEDWVNYSSAIQIYCELREKLTHLESVLEAYTWLKSKKSFDISGFYKACEEISIGEAFFSECVHCKSEIFSGPGLRDKVVSKCCPACGKNNWEHPKTDHRLGHIATCPKSGDQQPLF
ncbi:MULTISPECIES: hypothetical protein [Gammaproteobacteria]|uniref:Uncharacterized protein n=1 Tax=Vibrio rhizosphaerae TaxID=398736 RepID=A0ABU4IQZ2_9VIBR|nr:MULTISPECIES: hypothetical protein [Gammaproteobacteria]EKF9762312.1 hypothetical protein [Vibrio cholerae]ELJ8607883.1 hypothetical protein [Vibrio cholerae]MBO2559365.1 hypothetical protein [Shewanella algae]MCG0008330.1 hypothetical protein [Vibrio parahaemolyticus]MDL2021127.1 hypothetical protein [Vibrio parahaemolyticus]